MFSRIGKDTQLTSAPRTVLGWGRLDELLSLHINMEDDDMEAMKDLSIFRVVLTVALSLQLSGRNLAVNTGLS